jgi:hypothetical protein
LFSLGGLAMDAPIDGNLIEFLQNRFSETHQKVSDDSKVISREAKLRRTLAYFLKAVAVFGGLAIAVGIPKEWSQVVGILIAVAITVDSLFSNHRRLLSVTEASNAYKNLLRDIEQTYNIKLAEVLKTRKTKGEAKAKDKLEALINNLLIQLQGEQSRIEKGLQDSDLKLLESIKLEHQTAAAATLK